MKRLLILGGLLFKTGICLAVPATLLILPFKNATGRAELDSLKKGLPDLLAVSFTDHADKVIILERRKLEAIMAEQSLKWENVMTQKAFQLGQLTQARYIVMGSLMDDHKGLRLQALLYETETTRLVKFFMVSGSVKQIDALCDKLVGDMIRFVETADKAAQSETHRVELPPDPDPETSLLMAQGLSFYHQNEFAKAIPEFMKVLEKQPQHVDAKYGLVKSYVGAGLKEDAALEAKDFLRLFPNDPRIR